MNLLLDTHALLWWWADEPLDDAATSRISASGTLVAVSAASLWEIAVKSGVGKLSIDGSTVDNVAASGFLPLPISLAHAERAGQLPRHHRDPFDRMLVAQAQIERLTIVTRDPRFDAYDIEILKC